MDWDLVVAGAGPAGCALAAKVAQGGAHVLLVEKEERPAAGREWIVDMASNTFEEAGVPEPSADDLFHEAGAGYLVSPDGSCVVPLNPSPLRPVRNERYVARLLEWGRSRGVTVWTGCEARRLLLERGSVTGLSIRRGGTEETVSSLVVADCTGISGVLRRQAPRTWEMSDALEDSDVVLARRETREIDVEGARAAQHDGFLMDKARLDRTGVRGAYSVETISLDLERGFIDILIGLKPTTGMTAEEYFDSLLEEMPFIGEKTFGGGAPIPVRRPLDSFVGDGLVVLGDSACQVIPMHGSGAASAMIAADCCAPAVLDAVRTGHADRRTLWGYNYDFMRRRGAMLAYYDEVREHGENMGSAGVNKMVKTGMLGAGEMEAALTLRPPDLGPAALATKLGAWKALEMLPGLAAAGIRAEAARRHYVKYPPAWKPGALADWQRRVPGRAFVRRFEVR